MCDTEPHQNVNIGVCKGFLRSENAILPEPMSIQMYVVIWRLLTKMRQNILLFR